MALLVGTHHGRRRGWSLPRPVAVAVTFVLVLLGWVLFRMRSATGIGHVYAGMLGLHGLGSLPGHLLVYVAISFAVVFGLREEWRWAVARWNVVQVAAAAILFVIAADVGVHEPSVHLLPLLMRRLALFLVIAVVLLAAVAAFDW